MKRRRSIAKIVVVSVVFAAVSIPVVAAAVRQVLHGRGAASVRLSAAAQPRVAHPHRQ